VISLSDEIKDKHGKHGSQDVQSEQGAPGVNAPGAGTDGADSVTGASESERSYEELRDLVDQREAELAEYLDSLKRAQAEMDNYRKRMIKEQAQIVDNAAQSVLLELLPVIDNLERAIVAAKTADESGTLFDGVELIYSQILGILEKQSVEVINPADEQFDPMKHEAVMQMESEAHSENTVIEVIQKGYGLKGRLLRPAMVVVAK
jgi:molecular chaperone GrpE